MNGFFLGMIEITAGMSLLILAMLFGLKLIGGKFTAKCRYILWTLVMIRLAIPLSFGILPALIEVPVEPEPVQMQMQTPVADYTPMPQNPVTMPPQEPVQMPNPPVQTPMFTEPEPEPVTWDDVKTYIPHAYLTGAAVFLLWNLLSYRVYTAKILRTAKEADAGTQEIYEAVCRKKGLSRPPILLVSPDVNSPAAFGLLRRRIVLPEIDFTENGLVGTLSHEVTHCRRGDLWIKALCLLARALHWFNPLVHLAAFRCEMEMELSCDESVLAGCDENTRAAYGEVMLDIIRRCRRNRGALTTHFNPKKNAVKARFTNILYGSGKKHGLWLIAVCLVLCLVAGAIFGKPKLTLDNIQEQNGFTILSQETKELTLTLPMEQLPAYDEIASAENAHLELDDIPVFTTDTTEVFLCTTGVSGHSPEGVEKDVLYLGFDIRHILTESGTIYTGNRVMNESGKHSYTSAFDVTQDTLQEYNRGIRWMGRGPSDQFHLYVDAALYTALQGDVEIGITLNEIVYARGNEAKVYGKENRKSSENDTAETLKIPEISLTQVNELPRSEDAALFSASPVGGNPAIYFFENDLSFYIRMYPAVDAECVYYSGSLTLPEGVSGGRVVRASGGGGSGETFVTICAEQDGRTVYLDYFINYNNDPFLPDFVYVLDDGQITELRDAMNSTSIHRDIYLCDDVYRSADTPTHGRADVFIPIALTDYTVTECQILLCEDGCDPTDVVSRAFWGYGPAWRIDQYEEYRTADGWRFDTRRYINEVPEDIRAQMAEQGAPDSVIWPREYLYLATLEPGLYAFIIIEPVDPEGEKPADEVEKVNALIRNMEVIVETPVDGEDTVDTAAIWQTFLDTVVAPYEENISSKEFLDLDGNGIEELLLFDLGNGICEIYTIEGGEVKCLSAGQQGSGHSLLTIYHDNPTMLAPPSLGAGEYVFYASRTPEDVSKTRYKNWFIPSPKTGGYVLYSTYGHTTSRTDQYFHFYSGEDTVLGKVLCVAELSRFEREAINSNPALGWECWHQGEKVSKNQYMTAVQECWDILEQRYGVTYTEEETLHRFDELRKTPDTSFELLADLLDTLKTEDPQAYMSRTPYGEEDSDVLHQAWGFSGAADCARSLAVDYTFEPLTAMEVQETTRITLHSPTEGEWKIHGWVNSKYIELITGGRSYFFRAAYKANSEICIGDTMKNWFDDAEYAAMPYQAVIPDTGQGFLAAAQTFVESWYGRNLQVSSGSEHAFSYVSCSVRDAQNRDHLIENGFIGENTYTYYITVIFVGENPHAGRDIKATVAGLYSGEDPTVPHNAYEFQLNGYITLEEDGWHGEVGGTGW